MSFQLNPDVRTSAVAESGSDGDGVVRDANRHGFQGFAFAFFFAAASRFFFFFLFSLFLFLGGGGGRVVVVIVVRLRGGVGVVLSVSRRRRRRFPFILFSGFVRSFGDVDQVDWVGDTVFGDLVKVANLVVGAVDKIPLTPPYPYEFEPCQKE